MGWSVYKKILSDEINNLISHYFLVDLYQNVIMHSKLDPLKVNKVYNITNVEFDIDSA
jgi:hypothetical protein